MLGSCHSLYCNVFFGVHNELSKPFVLFLFLLVPPSLPPPSPSPLLLFPPPTGCAFVTFATRAMAQNAIKTMHHSQTMEVLYPLAPVSHFPSLSPRPSHTYVLLPPSCQRDENEKRQACPNGWCPFITEHDSFFQSHSYRLQNDMVVLPGD